MKMLLILLEHQQSGRVKIIMLEVVVKRLIQLRHVTQWVKKASSCSQYNLPCYS